ncbi:arylsulfatase, partial [Novosphingobium endophyticum]|uniref:arylsulfatase n=1 Tax=Novosphingobium endophyticum TaxID=1955250 RepID=UPI001665E238
MLASHAAAEPTQSAGWRHYPAPPEAPKGAPNILLILTDDVGFGSASALGGAVPTPTFDKLAQDGLLYNRFHTTAMCSPTRAALLTGRNHHAVGSGAIADLSADEPGYTSVIPDSAATVAKVLGNNGYSTAFVGKDHNTPKWEYTANGPFDRWPNGIGFDYFYGFIGGYAHQFFPELVENRNLIHPPRQKDYIFDRDMTDHAIAWLRRQRNDTPSKPFMLYYAPGTAHFPLHAPADWIARFKGQFDQGWDIQREQIFARQKAMGVIPPDAELTPRPSQIPAWDSLTSDEKKVASRTMEAYAAALAFSDHQIGRVIEELRQTGQLDNTLVLFVQGDNGSAAENMASAFNQYASFGHFDEGSHPTDHINEIGGPNSLPAYPVGWAWAMDTPFQWAKQVASHLGGTRNPLVVYWPKAIREHGLRSQFHHVIDIAPTIYEATGVKPPQSVDGVQQQPIDGVSMVYSFSQPTAPSKRRSQYFEMLGNRAFYEDGWLAATTPKRMPWKAGAPAAEKDAPYKWELYHLDADFSQAHDLASSNPAKLKALQEGFMKAARQYQVLPLDDSFLPRFNAALRPSLMAGRTSFTYYPSDQRITPSSLPSLTGNWRAVAEIETNGTEPGGPIIAKGDQFTGWSLYIRHGKPMVTYRATDQAMDWVVLGGDEKLSPGDHVLAVAVSTAASGGASILSLEVDGQVVAKEQLNRLAHPQTSSYIGRAPDAPLIEDAEVPDNFSGGEIKKVTISL